MRIKYISPNSYQIDLDDDRSFILAMSITESKLQFILKLNQPFSLYTYHSIYTLKDIKALSKKYASYTQLNDILTHFNSIIKVGNFTLFINPVKAELRLHYDKEIDDANICIKSYQNDLTSLINNVNKFVKETIEKVKEFSNTIDRLNESNAKLKRENAELKEENEYLINKFKNANKTNKNNNNIAIRKDKFNSDLENLTFVKTIEAHYNWIYMIIYLRDGRLASCSEDKTIRVFNLKTYQCEIIIEQNTSVKYIAEIDDGKIVSCSYDKTISIWKIYINSYTQMLQFTAHKDIINKIFPIPNNQIVSCSKDTTIKIWSFKDNKQHHKTLKAHCNSVHSVIYISNTKNLISGAFDSNLCLWDLDEEKCIKKLTDVECCSRNSMIELSNGKIIIGGYNVFCIVDIRKFEVDKKVECKGIGFAYCFYEIKEGVVLCGGEKGFLYEIEYNGEMTSYKKRKCHNGDISAIEVMDNKMMATCAFDNTINLWL